MQVTHKCRVMAARDGRELCSTSTALPFSARGCAVRLWPGILRPAQRAAAANYIKLKEAKLRRAEASIVLSHLQHYIHTTVDLDQATRPTYTCTGTTLRGVMSPWLTAHLGALLRLT